MLSYHTAGDSHGEMLLGILEGFPAQVPIDIKKIDRMLERRQAGYGRSKRQQIEKDNVQIHAGIWKGFSTGAPLGLTVNNKLSKPQETVRPRTIPRPGHADLAGAWKYGWEHDFNPIIERSSARETAMRVVIGSICSQLLKHLGILVLGHVRRIGNVEATIKDQPVKEMRQIVENSPFHCVDSTIEDKMRKLVDKIKNEGNSLGGEVEVIMENVPPGLGGFRHLESRLDAQLAQAMMSIPSVKAVEIGDAIENSFIPGSKVHDEITIHDSNLKRKTNRAGGIEGGISNGEKIFVRNFHKPIPTMVRGIDSVDLKEGNSKKAPYIRSDVVVIPAASVVAEAVVAFVIARALLEKFGQDHLGDIQKNLETYKQRLAYYKN